MTRKDYKLIAKAISDTRVDYAFSEDAEAANQVLDTLAYNLTGPLTADNPNFNRAKFVQATR